MQSRFTHFSRISAISASYSDLTRSRSASKSSYNSLLQIFNSLFAFCAKSNFICFLVCDLAWDDFSSLEATFFDHLLQFLYLRLVLSQHGVLLTGNLVHIPLYIVYFCFFLPLDLHLFLACSWCFWHGLHIAVWTGSGVNKSIIFPQYLPSK